MGLVSMLPVTLCVLCMCMCTCCTAVAPDNDTCEMVAQNPNATSPTGGLSKVLTRGEAALLLLLGFGGFSVMLAFLYISIRRYVFRDADNLNTTFDAGGRVSMSLTAVTVASQLMWPGDLLQPTTVTIKNGMAGPFWYSTAAVINMILFPVLSVQFKTRAPGAKTFLQVIHGRFGKKAHVVFCCFALLLNLVVTMCLIAASVVLLQSLIQDASDEFCILIMATLFGSYSFVGGLGSTFYVSYFNAVTVFTLLAVLVIHIFYLPQGALPFGDLQTMYGRISCLQGPEHNLDRSFLTFLSVDALVWMVQGVFIASSVTFCDQASWQSRIAAKPVQGVLGFFGATVLWFAVPSTIGTSSAITYLSFSADNASLLLPQSDVFAGLVVPYVAQQTMGRVGVFMVLTMFTMLMMSTGSGEVMGVSSIIVYDIFQSIVYPYRPRMALGRCILCDKGKKETVMTTAQWQEGEPINDADLCSCPSVKECAQCVKDKEAILKTSGLHKQFIRHQCTVHGHFRTYQDALVQLKNWTILFVSMGIVPFGLLVTRSGIDLNWVYLTGGILTVPCFPGTVLSIVWVKTTGKGLVIGGITGLVCGVSVTLARASTLPGGLSNFLPNTSEGFTVMAGASSSFFVTLIVTVIVSLLTHRIATEKEAFAEWQKLRDIDNPLNPWVDVYHKEFPDLQGQAKPSYSQLAVAFRSAKLIAIVGSVVGIVFFVLFVPGVMASLRVLSELQFTSWVMTMHTWCFVTAAIVIVVTPLEEMRAICRELKRKNRHYDRFEARLDDSVAKNVRGSVENCETADVDVGAAETAAV